MHYKPKIVDIVKDAGSNGMFEFVINEEAQDGYTLHLFVSQLGPNGETEKDIMIFFYVPDDEE
ncbi:hypothetical protein [Bacillus cereus]